MSRGLIYIYARFDVFLGWKIVYNFLIVFEKICERETDIQFGDPIMS